MCAYWPHNKIPEEAVAKESYAMTFTTAQCLQHPHAPLRSIKEDIPTSPHLIKEMNAKHQRNVRTAATP